MKRITATELASRLSEVLDRFGSEGEEIVIERNHRKVPGWCPGLPALLRLKRWLIFTEHCQRMPLLHGKPAA